MKALSWRERIHTADNRVSTSAESLNSYLGAERDPWNLTRTYVLTYSHHLGGFPNAVGRTVLL